MPIDRNGMGCGSWFVIVIFLVLVVIAYALTWLWRIVTWSFRKLFGFESRPMD